MRDEFRLGMPSAAMRRVCIDWLVLPPFAVEPKVGRFAGSMFHMEDWEDKTQREEIIESRWVKHSFRPLGHTWAEVEALAASLWGGILEHPADSHAWRAHGLLAPDRAGGWSPAGDWQGWTCCVSQGNYGHKGDKLTWLYACNVPLSELVWGKSGKRVLVQAMSRKQRAATPPAFRDLLISIARSAKPRSVLEAR